MWKEKYQLRHVGRNVIAFSDERAAMFNALGETVFEVPLDGEGPSVVEMWRDNDNFYSCFVRGNIVTVFKKFTQVANFEIENPLELEVPAGQENLFEPLELLHTGGSTGSLLLTAKIGTGDAGN